MELVYFVYERTITTTKTLILGSLNFYSGDLILTEIVIKSGQTLLYNRVIFKSATILYFVTNLESTANFVFG